MGALLPARWAAPHKAYSVAGQRALWEFGVPGCCSSHAGQHGARGRRTVRRLEAAGVQVMEGGRREGQRSVVRPEWDCEVKGSCVCHTSYGCHYTSCAGEFLLSLRLLPKDCSVVMYGEISVWGGPQGLSHGGASNVTPNISTGTQPLLHQVRQPIRNEWRDHAATSRRVHSASFFFAVYRNIHGWSTITPGTGASERQQ